MLRLKRATFTLLSLTKQKFWGGHPCQVVEEEGGTSEEGKTSLTYVRPQLPGRRNVVA